MTTGIYCITNLNNGKKYIGQSINIEKRINSHKYHLKHDNHVNDYLQRSYNKNGEDSFSFEVLMECPEEDLDKLEIECINKYDSTNPSKGYNLEHGGTKAKRPTLTSKMKRRGKWSHSINPNTKENYAFRNMCSELWNTSVNYVSGEYSTNKINLKTGDINRNKSSEEYIVEMSEEYIEMTDYEKLIKKYYSADGRDMTANFRINKAEKVTTEYARKLKKDSRRKHRHLLLDELLSEIPFHLTKAQITQIRYLIDRFNDGFKDFHRRSSNETILLGLIMIQYKYENPNINVEKYSISKKYKLTNPIFQTIQNKLIFKLMQTTELRYALSEYYDHYILVKEGR